MHGVDLMQESLSSNFFHELEDMKLKIEQQKKISSNREITIDTTIAGGFDPTVVKSATISLQCIRTIIENYKAGKQKCLFIGRRLEKQEQPLLW
jgi:hypothetical protein